MGLFAQLGAIQISILYEAYHQYEQKLGFASHNIFPFKNNIALHKLNGMKCLPVCVPGYYIPQSFWFSKTIFSFTALFPDAKNLAQILQKLLLQSNPALGVRDYDCLHSLSKVLVILKV